MCQQCRYTAIRGSYKHWARACETSPHSANKHNSVNVVEIFSFILIDPNISASDCVKVHPAAGQNNTDLPASVFFSVLSD